MSMNPTAKIDELINTVRNLSGDTTGATSGMTLATLIAGEDLVNNVLKTEQRFSSSGAVTADGVVKGSAGFVHSVSLMCNDSAPTAGNIDIYDNASAASGTKIYSTAITTTYFLPTTVMLNVSVANGIYVDFTTTNDVNVFVSYR